MHKPLVSFGSEDYQEARRKSEEQLLDHAADNLLGALKKEMLEKDGRIDLDKLRKGGYSSRLLTQKGQISARTLIPAGS